MTEGAPIPCVGAVLVDEQGRVLLVRRANEPGRGLWSLPGGRVEPGETDEQAVVREVGEETGLTVTVGRLAGRVRIGRYDVADYVCDVVRGIPFAASDATDVAWVDPRTVPTTPDLVDILVGWGVLTPPVRAGNPVQLAKTRPVSEQPPTSFSQQPIGIRVLMVPVLPFVALWLAAKTVGRWVDRVVAALERALFAVVRPIGRALLRGLLAFGRWLRRAAAALGHALAVVAKLLARPMRLLARFGAAVGRGLARAATSCARALAVATRVVLIRPLLALVRAMAPLLRAVQSGLALCGRFLVSAATAAVRLCRAAGRRAFVVLRFLVRPFVVAAQACLPLLRAVGRVLARGCALLGRGFAVVGRALAAVGRALAAVGRVVGRGLTAAGRALGGAAAVVLRPLGAAVRAVTAPVAAAARAIAAPFRSR